MAKYGIPYMGSKQAIADKIFSIFPNAENFYDLFGGGFSITHAMVERRGDSFNYFHFNEIRDGVCGLIKDAIKGKYCYKRFKPTFITREEFLKKKDKDPYIKLLWSFGNNGRAYLFSKEIEPYKKSMHNAIVFNIFDDIAKKVMGTSKFADGYSIRQKRLHLRGRIDYYLKNGIPDLLKEFISDKQLQQLERLEQLQRLQELQQLERLEQLQRLQRLQQLEQLEQKICFYSKDYRDIAIKKNSIIYCDIPYQGTASYDEDFSHKDFFDWASSQKEPVFISEYNISDDRFTLIKTIGKNSLLNNTKEKKKKVTEKIYANKAALIKIRENND